MTGPPVVATKIYTAFDKPPSVPMEGLKWDKSLTKQSEAKATDINVIMARYEKTGVIPVSKRQAFFADVSTVADYRSVIERVRAVSEYFMEQPAELRAEFENDPAVFLDFISDPQNVGELRELGLLEEEGEAPPVEEVAPAPAEGVEIPPQE